MVHSAKDLPTVAPHEPIWGESMSALDDLKAINAKTPSGVDIRLLNPFFWNWYHLHLDDTIVKRKIVFFTLTVKVRDLRPLFVSLFGEEVINDGSVIR